MPIYRRRPTVQPIAAINLTSLLDVTFVLLLAFMIVAPTLKTGLPIDLPEVAEPPPLTQTESVTISLRKMDNPDDPVWYYLEGKRVSLDELKEGLQILQRRRGGKIDVLIEPDKNAPVEALLKVFATTNALGIDSVGVVTEREKK